MTETSYLFWLNITIGFLQVGVVGVVAWLVSRIGELNKTQNEINGSIREMLQWRMSHDKQDDTWHAEEISVRDRWREREAVLDREINVIREHYHKLANDISVAHGMLRVIMPNVKIPVSAPPSAG